MRRPLLDTIAARHEWWLLAAALAAAALVRAVLLGGAPAHLRSDEAVVGVMALDIAGGNPVPLFFPGNDRYGGGHVVEALLMLPLFRLLGPTEVAVKLAPMLESLLLLVVIHLIVRRTTSAGAALLCVTLLGVWAPFAAAGFMVIGGMATLLAGFLGLLLLLKAAAGPRLAPVPLFAAGAALGFSIYCFGYGVFFLAFGLLLLAVTRHRSLRREAPALAALAAGLVAGASPLLAALGDDPGGGAGLVGSTLLLGEGGSLGERARLALDFFRRDVPSLFHYTLTDYPQRLSVFSWATCIVSAALGAVALAAAGRPGRRWREAWREGRPWRPQAGEWSWVALGAIALYGALYLAHPLAGRAPRYLMPLLPFPVILAACGIRALGGRSAAAAAVALALFVGLQVPLLRSYYREGNQVEWGIKVDGEDLRRTIAFLEERGYDAVVTPYEIKWRIAFLTRRRITAAAHVFGADRETAGNAEVVRRVDAGAPLVMVLDREMSLPAIGQFVNPEGAFYPERFFGWLREEGITWESVPIGGLVVLHRFSRHVALPPVADDAPAGRLTAP